MKKISLLLVMLVLSLLAISVVSAANDIAADLVGNDDTSDDVCIESVNDMIVEDNPVLSDENDGGSGNDVGTKNFSSLNNTINGNDDEDIYLDSDFTFNSDSDGQFSDGINITRKVTIHGNGNTIDANHNARIFNINTQHVVLKDIKFINGHNDLGGALYVYSAECTIINCSFMNNAAEGYFVEGYGKESLGGAVYSKSDYPVSFINCSFVNNSADTGGAIFSQYSLMENCSFMDNSATKNGGAVYMLYRYKISKINNCTFLSNTANKGGGVYIDSKVNITNSTFIGNKAIGKECSGGAVCRGAVFNCSFINNYAKAESGSTATGGAVYGDAVMCVFENNYVTGGSGGAVYGQSIINCSFDNNFAKGGGAACANSIINCSFVNCYSTERNGGALIAGRDFLIENCTFCNCYSANNGGAICDDMGTNQDSYIKNCSFVNCKAKCNGGAIYMFSIPTIVNCSFVNNNADCDGGAIYYMELSGEYGSGLVSNCSFNNNHAKESGGAIYGGNYTNCIFNANIAEFFGNNWINEELENKIIYPKIYASPVSVVYNDKKYLTITLKDGLGNPISGAEISVSFIGFLKTDKNGQVKVAVGKLVPGTNSVRISFGTLKYQPTYKIVDVVVKKAKPKFVAKAKTFKKKVKVKKYTVTFKNNKNIALKKVKLTLKVNGKKFIATTNSKGKATFKITKLNKKRTYKATITFKGSKYYYKTTKTVKIKVK